MVNVKAIAVGVVLTIVSFIVVFEVLGGTSTTLINSSGNVEASGLPLAGLYSPGGVLLTILMLGIFIGLIVLAFKSMGGGK